MKNITFDDMMVDSFRQDPAYAAALLDEMIENGNAREFLIMLRQLCKAFGGVHAVAEKANLNGNTLYRTLSPKGRPHAETLDAVLRSMGLRLAVQPMSQQSAT